MRVEACGICHSDAFTIEGAMPGIEYPRVPGHEIAGRIETVGEDVFPWDAGQRVGVGWFGGHCDPCRRGDLISCINGLVPGIAYDGGYADHVVVPKIALASIPDDLSAQDAAPLLCASITTFNALRESGARPGDLVAILGIGGLGHLGVQFARRMGFETVAIARGTDKQLQAEALGAHHYVDATTTDVAEALQLLGGATTILATVTAPDAMSAAVGGLRPRGRMIVVGASADPMQIPPFALIPGSTGVIGHASGTSKRGGAMTSSLPADDPSRDLAVARPDTDEGLEHLAVVGDTYTVHLRGRDTGGGFALIDMLVPPGGGPPPHRHDFEETFHVLEGEIRMDKAVEVVAPDYGIENL